MRKCFICDEKFEQKDDLRRLLSLQEHLIKEHKVEKSLDELLMIWKKRELNHPEEFRGS